MGPQMSAPSEMVAGIIASIVPASAAHAAEAQNRIASILGPKSGLAPPSLSQPAGVIERLAGLLAGAQHATLPIAKQRIMVVVAGDHGCASPCASGPDHPTVVAATSLADGSAVLAQVLRRSATPFILVNAGAAASSHLPPATVVLGNEPSRDFTQGPAMSLDHVSHLVDAGVALAVSISERQVSLLVVGAMGVGADAAAAALLRAAGGQPSSGIDLLVQFGGPETAVLAGLMLGAASLKIPIIVDSYATGAAALVAAAAAPAIAGYLVPAHRGSHAMPGILSLLGLAPLFDVGLGGGDGTGAAMVVPLIDQIAELVSASEAR